MQCDNATEPHLEGLGAGGVALLAPPGHAQPVRPPAVHSFVHQSNTLYIFVSDKRTPLLIEVARSEMMRPRGRATSTKSGVLLSETKIYLQGFYTINIQGRAIGEIDSGAGGAAAGGVAGARRAGAHELLWLPARQP